MKHLWRAVTVVLLLAFGVGGLCYFHPLWVVDELTRLKLWRNSVQSEYVEVEGGYCLHYDEARPSNGSAGTPLVLVHGLGAKAEDWAALIPGLAAAGFHVYAVDLLGYGRSPRPDVSYSISMQEEIVVAFMRALHLERADLAGWSMGGWVVMKLTLDHPERVNRLVVYDSAGVYFPSTQVVSVFSPKDVAGVHRLLAVLTPRPIRFPDFVARDAVRKMQRNEWIVQRSVGSMLNGRDLLDFRLGQIERPTLVVWGSHDDLIPLSAGEKIHQKIRGSSLTVVEGCGHLTPSECWRPALKATVGFLQAEPAATGGRTVVAGEWSRR